MSIYSEHVHFLKRIAKRILSIFMFAPIVSKYYEPNIVKAQNNDIMHPVFHVSRWSLPSPLSKPASVHSPPPRDLTASWNHDFYCALFPPSVFANPPPPPADRPVSPPLRSPITQYPAPPYKARIQPNPMPPPGPGPGLVPGGKPLSFLSSIPVSAEDNQQIDFSSWRDFMDANFKHTDS